MSAMPVLGLALWLAAGWERPVAVNDFVEYWAASRQLLAGENPYAPAQMLDRERTAGFTGAPPLMMRNPPWVFPFTLPFGALPFALGQRLWFGLGMVSVLISIQLLWRLYASEKLHYRLIWLTTATFLPVETVLAGFVSHVDGRAGTAEPSVRNRCFHVVLIDRFEFGIID